MFYNILKTCTKIHFGLQTILANYVRKPKFSLNLSKNTNQVVLILFKNLYIGGYNVFYRWKLYPIYAS